MVSLFCPIVGHAIQTIDPFFRGVKSDNQHAYNHITADEGKRRDCGLRGAEGANRTGGETLRQKYFCPTHLWKRKTGVFLMKTPVFFVVCCIIDSLGAGWGFYT
jgi:hypothetical protein